MKTNYLKSLAALLAVSSLALSASTVLAQEATATTTVQPATVAAPAPPMAYGVSQILRLQQAKVGDDTTIAYIKNSGNSYGLNADQIIYLRQQGVSSAVINAMLTQPAPGVLAAAPTVTMPQTPAPPAPAMYDYQPAGSSTTIVGPSVSAVDPSAAANYYYYQPAYYSGYSYPYCYPAYGFYPGVSVSLGWRGGWGGFHGGGFPGGGFHGGFGGFHGGFGGGFHGGGGGGWHH